MDSTVLVALITSGLGLVGTLATVVFGQKKTQKDTKSQLDTHRSDIGNQLAEQQKQILAELDKHNAIQDERIKALSDRVEKHNHVIERTYELEGRVQCMSKRITDLSARVNAEAGKPLDI